jgi:hypothetical protein
MHFGDGSGFSRLGHLYLQVVMGLPVTEMPFHTELLHKLFTCLHFSEKKVLLCKHLNMHTEIEEAIEGAHAVCITFETHEHALIDCMG